MSVFTSKNFNVINQVMNDGSGDYAWTENLVDYLLSKSVPIENIKLIYFNVYDFGEDLKNIVSEKTKLDIGQFKEAGTCKIMEVSKITPNDLIKYVFKKAQYDSLEIFNDSLDRDITNINNFNDNIYDFTKFLTPNNYKNVFDILNKILSGKKVDQTTFKDGDILCEVSKSNLDDEILNPGNSAFPISKIRNLTKYPSLQIYYFHAMMSMVDFSEHPLFSESVNLLFMTQEDETFNPLPNEIRLREGGDDRGGAVNCSTTFGYIQAKPEGNREKFLEYFSRLGLDPTKTCISYISLGETSLVAAKLSKFIKLLCYSSDYLYDSSNESSVYSILMVNEFNRVFSEQLGDIDKDIVITKNGDKYQAEFNGKKINIVKGEFVNISSHQFNFAYLLQNTNQYCYLSGDNSYMEGLTLNKKVIHIGMGNKYNMMNQLQSAISRSLRVSGLKNTEPIDEMRKTIVNISANFSGYNNELKKHSEFLAKPDYLRVQGSITSKDFYTSLDTKIRELFPGEMQKKYLKYKQKYLQLKKLMSK